MQLLGGSDVTLATATGCSPTRFLMTFSCFARLRLSALPLSFDADAWACSFSHAAVYLAAATHTAHLRARERPNVLNTNLMTVERPTDDDDDEWALSSGLLPSARKRCKLARVQLLAHGKQIASTLCCLFTCNGVLPPMKPLNSKLNMLHNQLVVDSVREEAPLLMPSGWRP